MDEHEQGELVRSWLRQNGGAILGGIAIGLAGILGWQWWQHAKAQHKLDAAVAYQAMEEAIERKDLDSVDQLAGDLSGRYADTPYGTLGLLQLADQKLKASDLEGASAALERAGRAAQDPALAGLVNLRLAQVEVASGKAQQALDRLDAIKNGDFAGLVAETRGDALMALGRGDDAVSAYRDALAALETGAPNRSIVEMKLADLGASPDAPGV